MKPGRNDRAPVAAARSTSIAVCRNEPGKQQRGLGVAQSVADELAAVAAERPFESLEERLHRPIDERAQSMGHG